MYACYSGGTRPGGSSSSISRRSARRPGCSSWGSAALSMRSPATSTPSKPAASAKGWRARDPTAPAARGRAALLGMADRLPARRPAARRADRGGARPHVATRAYRHPLPPRDRPEHAPDRRERCVSLLDYRNGGERRRAAGDDAPVPVAPPAALSADRQPGLQHRGKSPADGVLLGSQAPGRPRSRRAARPGGSRLPLLRSLHPFRQRRQPTHARLLRGALRPGGLGALVLSLPAILAALVGAPARRRRHRGGWRPPPAPPPPADRRPDGAPLDLQPHP